MLIMINKYDNKKVGARIAACRKETKIEKAVVAKRGKHYRTMSQSDLAEKCNVTRQTVAKWENGELSLTIDDLLKLSSIFDCDPGFLLCEFDCRRHVAADINAVTGLSEDAIAQLASWNNDTSGLDNSYCFESDILNQMISNDKFKSFLIRIHYIATDIAAENCLLSVYNSEAKKEGLQTTDKIVWTPTSDMDKAIRNSRNCPTSDRGQSALSALAEIQGNRETDELQAYKIVNEMISEIATDLAKNRSDVKYYGRIDAEKAFNEEMEKIIGIREIEEGQSK